MKKLTTSVLLALACSIILLGPSRATADNPVAGRSCVSIKASCNSKCTGVNMGEKPGFEGMNCYVRCVKEENCAP